ncbi:hypothetical protein K1T71_004212 [Dendrolimus kikuchii]|uniref:Uncharacterized protein n=1 Tax=Dendrolimus kikuchii TaxID=765133 RepID=A0ACC1DB30_9NEOP|nr:hypothetical protein K1T71_004212 [Dendrolimus kikuchii]
MRCCSLKGNWNLVTNAVTQLKVVLATYFRPGVVAIHYADDMVLLSPSIGGLRRLLSICESYAVNHGLRYNVKKSEVMIFKSGAKSYDIILEVYLCGKPISRVSKFKYLGHWVTEDLKDDCDIDRERRSLTVR